MGDILKEAIADAKAVRATALANAKMALEEAFTPQLKSMLSAKLREDDDEFEGEEDDEEESDGEGNPFAEDEEEFGGDDEEDVPAEEAYEDEEMGDDEPDMEEEGVIEINGVKYAPVVTEDEAEFGGEDEEDEVEEELDLEAIIRELETEINEEDDAYDEKASADRDGLAEEDDAYDEKASADRDGLAEADDDDDEVEIDESLFSEGEDDDDDEKVEEQSDSSKIGSADNKVDVADAGDEDDPGKGDVHEQLREYKEAVVFLKDKLHEVNILNAKLLFTNKLFKEFSLDNGQKLKVVETFDRTQSTREIKLVYSTLCEQFSDNTTIIRKKSISESASSSIGSTKPSKGSRKVITEESEVADRFKKLAGLL
jgi:hypothetical protein